MHKTLLRLQILGVIACAALGALTLLARDWIELVFRIDPDAGSGATEIVMVVTLFAVSLFLAIAARRQWRLRRVALVQLPSESSD
jgi:hypothetical protein